MWERMGEGARHLMPGEVWWFWRVSSSCATWREQKDPRAISVEDLYKAVAAGLGDSHPPGGRVWLAGPGCLPRPNGNA